MLKKEICQAWIINLHLIRSIKGCTAPSNSQGEHLILMRNYIFFFVTGSVILFLPWFGLRDLSQINSSILFLKISWLYFIISHRPYTFILTLCELTVINKHLPPFSQKNICVKIGLSFSAFSLGSLSPSIITSCLKFPWILLNLNIWKHFIVFHYHPTISQKSCESEPLNISRICSLCPLSYGVTCL